MNRKNLLIALLAIGSLITVTGTVYKVATTLIGVDAQEVVFCWDIHDTLLKKRKKHTALRYKLIRKLIFECWEAIPFVKEVKKRGAASGKTERDLRAEAEKYRIAASLTKGNLKLIKKNLRIAKKLEEIADIFGQFELTYKNRDGVTQLLHALNKRGYKQHHVASNIDCNKYIELKKMFPELFNEDMVQDGLTVDADAITVLKKPDHMYFAKLQKMFNPNNDKLLVFVDDKKESVQAARACNMIGIHMTSIKKFVKKLNTLGLDLQYCKQKKCINGKLKKVRHIT